MKKDVLELRYGFTITDLLNEETEVYDEELQDAEDLASLLDVVAEEEEPNTSVGTVEVELTQDIIDKLKGLLPEDTIYYLQSSLDAHVANNAEPYVEEPVPTNLDIGKPLDFDGK